MCNATINKIIPFSAVDGIGNRLVIFFQKCNFNCIYCHNPETINLCNNCGKCISICPNNAITLKKKKIFYNETLCDNCGKCISECPNSSSPKSKIYSLNEIKNIILKYKDFISGVTITGGEASLQISFWTKLYKFIKKNNLTLFLDTNGSINSDFYEIIENNIDYIMLDFKTFINEDHIKLTGKTNKTVKKFFEYFAKKNMIYEVRTVVFEGFIDMLKNVKLINEYVKSVNPSIKHKIIKYREYGVTNLNKNNILVPSELFINKINKIIQN